MAATPEGKVKQLVKALLGRYEGLYQFWPVPYGMGDSSLDCLICYKGRFIAVETKAPGKKPTPRQKICIDQIEAAGGAVFVIDGEASLLALRDLLELIRRGDTG